MSLPQLPQKPREIQKKQEDLIKEAYEQWLNHPTTGLLIQNLKKHREAHMGTVMASIGNLEQLNKAASNIKTLTTILQVITDWDTFFKLVNNKLQID